jgi:hypothetical protein
MSWQAALILLCLCLIGLWAKVEMGARKPPLVRYRDANDCKPGCFSVGRDLK